MKIKVRNLESNPFRDLKHYKYDPEKLISLSASITETSFWDNLLCRPHPTKKDKYQIPYGHHRLKVLQTLRIKEIDIPVRDIPDYMILKMMANENMDTWGQTPAAINQTVKTVKEYLDAELAKYTWKLLSKSTKQLFTTHERYNQLRNQILNGKQGVGQNTILRFLGKGWKQWKIKEALETLYGKKSRKTKQRIEFDREAIESMETTEKAANLKKAIEDYKIPKGKQKEIAKKVKKSGVGSRNVHKEVAKHIVKDRTKPKGEAAELSNQFTDIEKLANQLSRAILKFNIKMEKLGVKEIKGLQTIFIKESFSKCLKHMKKMYQLFGHEILMKRN